MMRAVLAAVSGIVFGLGLALSQMMNPAKVLGFFNVFGTWDPTLAFVMAGALSISIPGYWWIKSSMTGPVTGGIFHIPARSDITMRLIVGSAIFGAGWAIIGLCPGPAFAGLGLLLPESWIYMAAMVAGMALGLGVNRLKR
ncbi:MAG: YeeE/YedE family protein [Rhodospirillales bacterium]|nr:YeeE/YedE family protein [Rhodospirillales bacterium]